MRRETTGRTNAGLPAVRLRTNTAQVTESVYDSPTGRARLIPQGARLIGVNDSQVAFGQSRLLLVWTRLIMPNGRSIVLERQLGADAGGYSGLEDEVDNHWGDLFKAALLSTVLAWGQSSDRVWIPEVNTAILQALRLGATNSAEPNRTAGGSSQPQRSADTDDSARISCVRNHHSRSRA